MIAEPFSIDNPFTLQLAHTRVDEYFSSIWCMHEDTLHRTVDGLRGMDLALHIRTQAEQTVAAPKSNLPGTDVETDGRGIAIVRLRGPLMKQASSFSGGTSTIRARKQIRDAVHSEEIRGILLAIESPGGTSAGTYELADDIRAAGKKKPVWSFCEDLCASAAYWAASQSEKIFANPAALVGSIGTYAVLEDTSGVAEKLGATVHVIRAGAMKGAGTPGTKITQEMLDEWQKIVNSLNSHFVADVEKGRGLTAAAVAELSDGRIHVGKAAVENRLIDGVQSWDRTLAEFRKHVSSTTPSRSKSMSTDTAAAPVAATFRELKASLHGADADFLAACQEKELTLDAAKSCWMTTLDDRLAKSEQKVETLQKENGELKAKLEASQSAKPKPGFQPHAEKNAGASEGSGDAVATFNEAVAAKVAGGMRKSQAVTAVVKENPQLHAEYLAAVNSRSR